MQYIILLRGINVGGRNIKMEELKSCFEKEGFKNVRTILQSGNVIIESQEKSTPKLTQRIESALLKSFGYSVKVLVVTQDELNESITQYPFSKYGPEFHRYAVFTEDGFEKTLVKECVELDKSVEEIKQGNKVVYWRVLKGHTLDSTFGKYLAKVSTKHLVTNRNMNTLEKILGKCE